MAGNPHALMYLGLFLLIFVGVPASLIGLSKKKGS